MYIFTFKVDVKFLYRFDRPLHKHFEQIWFRADLENRKNHITRFDYLDVFGDPSEEIFPVRLFSMEAIIDLNCRPAIIC